MWQDVPSCLSVDQTHAEGGFDIDKTLQIQQLHNANVTTNYIVSRGRAGVPV